MTSTTSAITAQGGPAASGRKQSRVGASGGLYARLALDRQTKKDAFRLRHLCYHSNGYIDARANGEFSDPYDTVPSNTTIVIYKEARAVASVRVCGMDPSSADPKARNLPVSRVFPDDFAGLLKPAERAVEINRLVCHPDQSHDQGLVFILFRMVGFMIQHHDPDLVTSCVRSNHVSFYKRLRFEAIGTPKQYTGLNFVTSFLVCRRESYDKVSKAIPALSISPAAHAGYSGLFRGASVPVFSHA